MYWGTVIEHFGDELEIVWDFDDATSDVWSSKEARYRVDRGQMRFIPPPKERRIRLPDDQIFCKICGKPRQLKCGCPRPGALKPEEWGQKVDRSLLTPSTSDDMMVISNEGNALNERKGAMMAKKAAAPVVEDEIDDLVELDDVAVAEDTEEVTDGGDMLTAKAAATKLGTDARTLRKFLRKKQGTVGQGQRWAISADDIPALKAEFDTWAKGARSTEPKADKAPKAKAAKAQPKDEPPAPDADELEEIDDLIEELDDLDFDED